MELEGQGRGIIMGVTRLLLLGPFYSIQTNFLYFFAHDCTTMAIINPPERKLAKCTFVHCTGYKMYIHMYMNIKAKGEMSMLLKKALSLIPKEFPNSNREAAVSQHLKFVSFNKYLKHQN